MEPRRPATTVISGHFRSSCQILIQYSHWLIPNARVRYSATACGEGGILRICLNYLHSKQVSPVLPLGKFISTCEDNDPFVIVPAAERMAHLTHLTLTAEDRGDLQRRFSINYNYYCYSEEEDIIPPHRLPHAIRGRLS